MEFKNYNVILFDLDGTITDSKQGIIKSIQYSLSSFGIIEKDTNKLQEFIGPSLAESFKKYYDFDDYSVKKAIVKYREYYAKKGIFENLVYPLIPELLQKLYEENRDLILATSKPEVYAEKVLNYFNLSIYFSLVVGSELDGTRVNKVEIISHALSRKGLKASESIVMIGDRKHDIIGAKNVGIDSVGVLYGYGSMEELESVNPTFVAKSVGDLWKILL
ncbi:MAG: HAD-IA family hydrolase [Tepidanaerobacteraceae bacterium]|jgi:phosphoglycolate phosphatase|nr:HAD-IA family hydrolase [Thermoanaerobacterales bacterium]